MPILGKNVRNMLTMEKLRANLLVTNVNFTKQNTQVGTLETVRPFTNFENKKYRKQAKNIRECQWLAGLIDGDGCFQISEKNYTSQEITVHAKDEPVFDLVKQKYGGSIKPRSGLNCVRYRLHNKTGMIQQCTDVNGYIRHPVRYEQFQKVCNVLQLIPEEPDILHSKHGWFRGIFDADGTVTLNKKSKQITISVTQKDKNVPTAYFSVFGGSLYKDKSQNEYYKWAVQSKANVQQILEFLNHFPVHSSRRRKLSLIPDVYDCIAAKAYKFPKNTALYKKWQNLLQKWQESLRFASLLLLNRSAFCLLFPIFFEFL